ncbi:hypothetical protein NQ036_03795 [Brevibacterium sp. 91QC2O2]|uniref:hypothetical protein n=1 Tax=Brevibacterium TaxID=1696 RepID=UPI00211B852A|nr:MULTISPECIES: hypothetical protein [unclassified Brevibacterium]MCQ9367370.1 hypothetical protein [Brevibacterium sp. 91QC2O2]MCQ9384617.1 hypothetical protein [Brevibacterium sp. 68QC2CO]
MLKTTFTFTAGVLVTLAGLVVAGLILEARDQPAPLPDVDEDVDEPIPEDDEEEDEPAYGFVEIDEDWFGPHHLPGWMNDTNI